ncbi:MAG: hypothetical protein JWQ09_4552 [Segetibacter sp.]|nr:hypothetical protein [Segetibacter sp.]
MLHDEGIEVNTAAAFNIEKVLFHTNLEVYNTFSKLKFRIVPILSRNKEEQDIIYKIFEKLDEKVKTESINIKPPDTKEPDFVVSKTWVANENWLDKLKSRAKKKRFWMGVLMLIAVIVTVALVIYGLIPVPTPKLSAKIIPDKTQVFENDTVHFTVQLPDTSLTKSSSLDWLFPDTIIRNEFKVAKVFHEPGNYLAKAVLNEEGSKKEDTLSYTVSVLCEHPPSVVIDREAATSASGQRSPRNNSYIPLFTNPSKDSASYKYNWYVNDELVSTSKILSYKSKAIGNNEIKLLVDCKGIHCSTDSLVATLSDLPPISVSVKGEGKSTINASYNWKNIFAALSWLLVIVIIPGAFIYRLLKPVQKKKTEEQPAELQEPYSIRFNNQEHVINTQKEIHQLADILRKRQVSDTCKLSMSKTIQSTVRSGGLPALAFIPITKPSDYLAFVETNNDDSHLERLFKYLIAKLENDQVFVTVYEYRKEPLFLSNEKLNHIRIPIEKVASLYADRTLLIFADTKNFVLPLKNTLKKWVTERLNTWRTKIIVTPFPKKDWDKKEQLLIEAKFTVVPADLNANSIIEKIINGNIETQTEASFSIPTTYTTKLYNFNEFESVKEYLGDENLLKWACSLAVYPGVDWNLTLAIGKKLEHELVQKGQVIDLVNYSNLLKISRISWLQDGMITDTLRIEMLKYLDNEIEMLARQTLVEQLNLLQDQVSEGSMIKKQFDVHQKMNSFLLAVYENKKPPKKDEAFIKEILQENQVDQAHEIYLNNGDDTLLKDPFKKGRTVNFRKYFRATALKRKMIAAAAVLLTVVVSFIVLRVTTGSEPWIKTIPSDFRFIIKKGNITTSNLVVNVAIDNRGPDDEYESSNMISNSSSNKSVSVSLNFDNDSISTTAIMIDDTAKAALLTIRSPAGQLLAQDSFKLNSKTYTIQLTESRPIPLNIYYQNASDLALASALEESLPSNFDVTITQQNFKDTGLRIKYMFETQKKDAELVDAIASKIFGRDLQVMKIEDNNVLTEKSRDGTLHSLKKPLVMYISSQEICTPLSVSALPKILNGNWRGDLNNRSIEINVPQNVIKYSTGDIKSFGLYSINEVCLRKNNVYRLTTKTDKGYKAFFVKNVNSESFDLSVCRSFYKKKEEINSLNETNCDKFNTMKSVKPVIRNSLDSPAFSSTIIPSSLTTKPVIRNSLDSPALNNVNNPSKDSSTSPIVPTHGTFVEKLAFIMPGAPKETLLAFANAFEKYSSEAGVNTPLRIAAFLANVGWESHELKSFEENLNYSADAILKTWPKRFKTLEDAAPFARNPQKLGNRVYANRMGNGDTSSGDGWKYRERGIFYTTGKEAYEIISKSINIDLIKYPDLLATNMDVMMQAAFYFWNRRNLNAIADNKDFENIVYAITGAVPPVEGAYGGWVPVGLESAKLYYKKALQVFPGK